jgi:hypothetical protein
VGYGVNPYTSQPYAPQIVKQADFGRVLAEFWADGPRSTAPPGHWNEIANDVNDRMEQLGIAKRIGGTGPVVDDLEWDVKRSHETNQLIRHPVFHKDPVDAANLRRIIERLNPVDRALPGEDCNFPFIARQMFVPLTSSGRLRRDYLDKPRLEWQSVWMVSIDNVSTAQIDGQAGVG